MSTKVIGEVFHRIPNVDSLDWKKCVPDLTSIKFLQKIDCNLYAKILLLFHVKKVRNVRLKNLLIFFVTFLLV